MSLSLLSPNSIEESTTDDIAIQKNRSSIVEICKDDDIYNGPLVNGLKQGEGKLRWSTGQAFEGDFFKDHLHGFGLYTWPDGNHFKGQFYHSQKDGYGFFKFKSGNSFEGLYKEDERFGPGVYTYENGSQDIGIWHRERLIRLCSTLRSYFTLNDHPTYKKAAEAQCGSFDLIQMNNFFSTESKRRSLASDFFTNVNKHATLTLPEGIETYCRDFVNLPLSIKQREDWDSAFRKSIISTSNQMIGSAASHVNKTPIMIKIQNHMNLHNSSQPSFNSQSILNSERSLICDGESGHLEQLSAELIKVSGEGNFKAVCKLLETGLIDPSVSDRKGTFPLIAAATNMHIHVLNLLLDFGANVNQLTDENITTLAACMMYYFPCDHFVENSAEAYISNHRVVQRKNQKLAEEKKDVEDRSSVDSESDSTESSHGEDLESVCLDDETFKSDKRILDDFHNQKLAGAPNFKEPLPNVQSPVEPDLRSISRLTNFDQSTDMSNARKKRLSSEKWETFESDANMVKLEQSVSKGLMNKTANVLCLNDKAVQGSTCRNDEVLKQGTLHALSVWKAEHAKMRVVIESLLRRGADPNSTPLPFFPVIMSVKCGDCDMLGLLLERGANADVRLCDEMGGVTALHIACGSKSKEAADLVQLLLDYGADPNIRAIDDHVTHSVGKYQKESDISLAATSLSEDVMKKTQWMTEGLNLVEDGGRSPLHIACDREDDYELSSKIVRRLLLKGANPNVIWSGHSPLSIAAASGNELAIDELILFGADLSLPLTQSLGSLLCVASHPKYESNKKNSDRIKLIDKLIDSGANILAPVVFGSKKLVGTVVDYIHWRHSLDQRIFKSPYHALTKQERQSCNDRKALAKHLAKRLRMAAVNQERKKLQEQFKDGQKSRSPSRAERFLYTGAGAKLSSETLQRKNNSAVRFDNSSSNNSSDNVKNGSSQNVKARKPMFKYCYYCSRSVGVKLVACQRCKEVHYCSSQCKQDAWDEYHKKECLRVKKIKSESEFNYVEVFRDKTLREPMDRARERTRSVVDEILDRHILLTQLDDVTISRHSGMKLLAKNRISPNVVMKLKKSSDQQNAKFKNSRKSREPRKVSGLKPRPNAKHNNMHKIGRTVEWCSDGATLPYLDRSFENYSFV